MSEPISLLELTRDDLTRLLAGWGQPRYRAGQVWDWIYKRYAADPAAMTDLPKDLRERLAAETRLDPLERIYEQRSSDGQTIKWLFRLPGRTYDREAAVTIETVLMLYEERQTVCISTQAGCAMGCVFCATGQAGLARNLTATEIVAQVLYAARWLGSTADRRPPTADPTASGGRLPSAVGGRLTNIVVMGMGEPMANYERTWQALRTITDPEAFGLGARHVTLSTVGLPQGIRRMADEKLHGPESAGQVNLAVSLHAPNDALRTQLVPVNHRYPIAEVMAAVRDYVARTNRRVTFEYALMNGINDTPALARALARLLKGLLCHVNLIPLNPVAESAYQPSTPERAAAFQKILEMSGIPATVRMRRGIDIDAGCGQLRRRVVDS
jgi:23S rRNA (adenine2503-C2)-methyltransferase